MPSSAESDVRWSVGKELIAAGFALTPLNGKVPTVKDWASTPPNKTQALGVLAKGNYGVVLTEDWVIVDVDPRNFPKGDAPLTRLMKDCGSFPHTFVVATGGGGLHIYFKNTTRARFVNSLPAYPGIEFKSAKRQVVGPGSIHPDTNKPYTVKVGTPANIAAVPVKLVEFAKVREAAEPVKGLETFPDDEQSIERFAAYLKSSAPLAVEGEAGDVTTFKVACRGRDFGLSANIVFMAMVDYWNHRCQPPWPEDALKEKVRNAYRYNDVPAGTKHPAAQFGPVEIKDDEKVTWIKTDKKGLVRCFVNALNFFHIDETGLKDILAYNQFTSRIEFKRPAPWHGGFVPPQQGLSDDDVKRLKAMLATRHSFEVPINLIEEVIVEIAHRKAFHPVRNWLEGLKWDGVHRLDRWLTVYAGVDSSRYSKTVGRKVICAAVARVLRPGVQFDSVLVLEGSQGVGKSRLCRALGGEWYGDISIDPHERDTIAAMQGKWIIEISEMEVTRRAEANALKAFLSRQTDKVRMAFHRHSKEYPRQCIFIGTINPEAESTYLKDSTGNRRFWPVTVGQINVDGLKAVREQLFAEAYLAVKNGEKLYIDDKEIEREAAVEAELRYAAHPWTERVMQWLETPEDAAGTLMEFVTSRRVFTEAIGGQEKAFDRNSACVIATILRRAGWEPHVKADGKLRTRGFKRPSEGL